MAKQYAAKVFAYEELSFEFEDLVQEFRLKIFTSIKSYGRRWLKYRRGEASRPVPIKAYIGCACGNKMRDFMKYISRENHKIRIDEIDYDFGVEDDMQIDTDRNIFVVRGVDLLEGLRSKERMVFSLFLRGYNMTFINKVYTNTKQEKMNRKSIIEDGDTPFDPIDIINMQKDYLLKKYGSDLKRSRQIYQCYKIDD
jgi:DNA-directed RNA polymerase specialized sigma24 family protein